jgi:hypothetical protein
MGSNSYTIIQQQDQECPSGTYIGAAATSKLGFYGATPVVQQAAITAAPTDTTTLIAAVVYINKALTTLGLTA